MELLTQGIIEAVSHVIPEFQNWSFLGKIVIAFAVTSLASTTQRQNIQLVEKLKAGHNLEMAPQTEFVSKTQLYLKVKKPMLERQRRARINKCLDTLKELVAHMQADDAILRMDKAEMLESILNFVKSPPAKVMSFPSGDSFRYGFMNAVNEVSRVMACTPGMNVDVGKAVMTHLGGEFNRVLNIQLIQNKTFAQQSDRNVSAMSPASSGYQSGEEADKSTKRHRKHSIWRPW